MKKLGFAATRGEGWRAANVICGYTLDLCQGRGDERRRRRGKREERSDTGRGEEAEVEAWPESRHAGV